MLLPTLERDLLPHYLSYPVGTRLLAEGLHSEFPDFEMGVRFRQRAIHPTAEAEKIRRDGGPYPFLRVLINPLASNSSKVGVEFIVYGMTKRYSVPIRQLLANYGFAEIREWITGHRAGVPEALAKQLTICFSSRSGVITLIEDEPFSSTTTQS